MLELKKLSFEVDNQDDKKEIIKNVDLVIEDKRFVVITGPNGGGKSTLAKLVMGIEQPTSGQILLDGKDITNMPITERAKNGIGYAFQQPVRFKGLLVRDMIELSAGTKMTTEQACVYLSEVGLCAVDYIDRELNATLSGGELKRIEIAMVIARGTKLSIFDEPEAGIDLWSFHNLIRVFEQMQRKTSGCIMIISHQERILDIADQIVVLAGGVIQQIGTKEEIMPGLLAASDTCSFYRGDQNEAE